MKILDNVTLVAVSSVKIRPTIKALEYSMKGIKFGKVKFLTHKKPLLIPKDIEYVQIEELKNIDAFNYFMIYELHKYIDTDYALLVHSDGFVVNPEKWQDKFLQYDYIGSPWPLPEKNDKVQYRDIYGNICRVGNSVSIRSKRLLELPEKVNMEWEPFHGWYNEDGFICCNNRHIFEQYGCKIAPLEIAKYFGHESMIPEIEGIVPFVFHKWAGTNAKYPKFYGK